MAHEGARPDRHDEAQRGRAADGLGAEATAAQFPELGVALGIIPSNIPANISTLPPLLLFPGEGAVPLDALLHEEARRQAGGAEPAGTSCQLSSHRTAPTADGEARHDHIICVHGHYT